ncbi:FAD:protein FMN transferase [Pseudarthrobacter sp. J1738]|uniref:FAD:protein FMN transferase n=1 Tax=unclassified Pseudarthrobacter TaxID=2647000 RepID=UPI003D2CD1F6
MNYTPAKTADSFRSRTFQCMGTVISLSAPPRPHISAEQAADELEAATAVVEQVFDEIDERFSLYRPDSEASQLARGELHLTNASAVMREQYAAAIDWRNRTNGAFDPVRNDGVVDLSGVVKAYAISSAAQSLHALGVVDWCLNAGGDVLVSGSPEPRRNEVWQAGIVDPANPGALIAAHPLSPGRTAALATSGSAERGDHIWQRWDYSQVHDHWEAPKPREGSQEFVQVSVAAADIITADVLATAVVAGGHASLRHAADTWDVDILAIQRDGQILATPGFRA